MSGVPSYLRRTEDLKRLKTRALYVQGADGSLPGTNTLPVFGTAGDIQFSEIQIVGGDSMVIPGDLTVDGSLTVGAIDVSNGTFGTVDAAVGNFQDLSSAAATIQDLSANSIWTNTETVASRLDICGSAAVLGGLSIGQAHGVHELDVNGHVFIDSDGSAARSFSVPGIYTFTVPASIGTISFEMIGSGGAPGGGGNIGGTGGYMRGTINVGAFTGQTITVNVGAAGGSTSYIAIAGTVLFTVAGGGGGGGGGGPVSGVNGGAGGGDSFVAGVANGKDGVDHPSITNSYGRGGSATGGAGGAPLPGPPGISNGQAGANPAGYSDAAGGASGAGARGGNGYAGGGESGSAVFGAGSGGGGSSFYNTTYVSLTANYAGDNPGLVGILTGYGRSGQGGFVSISYAGQPSLQTTGDIVCGGNLDVCGSFAIQGQFDICGNLSVGGYIDGIRMANSFYYRQPSGGLFRVPQRVLVYSETGRTVTSSVSAIQIATLGPPFDTLKKIEVEINGSISVPAAAGTFTLNGGVNNAMALVPMAQSVSALNTTIFTAKHTFEMSKTPAFLTRLLDYGSYEGVAPVDGSLGSAQYHPTNINIGTQTIGSLDLSTTAGISALIDIDIYAYV